MLHLLVKSCPHNRVITALPQLMITIVLCTLFVQVFDLVCTCTCVHVTHVSTGTCLYVSVSWRWFNPTEILHNSLMLLLFKAAFDKELLLAKLISTSVIYNLLMPNWVRIITDLRYNERLRRLDFIACYRFARMILYNKQIIDLFSSITGSMCRRSRICSIDESSPKQL